MSVANLRMKVKGVEVLIGFSSPGASSFFSNFSFMISPFSESTISQHVGSHSIRPPRLANDTKGPLRFARKYSNTLWRDSEAKTVSHAKAQRRKENPLETFSYNAGPFFTIKITQ